MSLEWTEPLTEIAPIRPLQLCADGGYQLRLGALGVPLIMVLDKTYGLSPAVES
jgi:energy-converting hydrogenase Eha subunit B